jgi:hypothetical protein
MTESRCHLKQGKSLRTRWAWIGFIACNCLAWVGWVHAVPGSGATNGPRLVCDAAEFDYGQVVNTQEVGHVFVLRNTGDAPVEIGQIYSGCGCTRTQASAATIPPGGTATVEVVFNLFGRSGERNISVYVNSNDPVNPVCQLQCRGRTYFSETDRVTGMTAERVQEGQAAERTIRPAIRNETDTATPGITVIPPEVVLIETGAGRFPVRYVMVRATGQKPFQVLSVRGEGVSDDLVGIHQTGAGWATLRVGPLTARPEWKMATIQLTTDMPGFETIPIRVILQPRALMAP